MNRMTAAIISAMVRAEWFKEAVKRKIETAVDTTNMEKRVEAQSTVETVALLSHKKEKNQ